MSTEVKPIPEGYHTVTPYLILSGADAAIAFYEKALGAEEIMRLADPGVPAARYTMPRSGSVIPVSCWPTSIPRYRR
jgi:PhnB protein